MNLVYKNRKYTTRLSNVNRYFVLFHPLRVAFQDSHGVDSYALYILLYDWYLGCYRSLYDRQSPTPSVLGAVDSSWNVDLCALYWKWS